MKRLIQGILGTALLTAGIGLANHQQGRAVHEEGAFTSGQNGDNRVDLTEGFPALGIVPKEDTRALEFLDQHPEYDGRGTIVAIFDTGCEPNAVGLTTTPQGESKFVDFIDATGSGDVDTSKKAKPENGKLKGLTGRSLTPSPDWTNPSGEFRLGMASAYDLFPYDDLIGRLNAEAKKEWDERQRARIEELKQQIKGANADSAPSKAELEARLRVLEDLNKNHSNPGPVYDCVVWNDGNLWRAVVDTDEDGDLADETVLTDYDKEPGFGTFSDASRLNFTVHIYDNGETLSIVVPSGDHGTHVAGIVGAYEPERPQRNGIAPGCRMISVKIGDTRLDGMETGAGLVRGMKAVLDHKCDLVNMSYGEPATVADQGRIPDLLNELVREHGVIFVSSAGNSGPALSTVGAPGGTGSAVIGVGAYISPAMMDVEYTAREKRDGTAYTWTSRGPTFDGDWGVDIFAPGGAIAPIPSYMLQPMRQMNGTSMASPNACGNISLLLSAMKQQNLSYSNWSVLRAIQNTAEVVEGADRFAQGPGLLQVTRAYEHLVAWHAAPGEQIELKLAVANRSNARGIYLRESTETDRAFEATVNISPVFPEKTSNDEKLAFELELAWSSDVEWASVGEHMMLHSGGNRFPVRVDPTRLAEGVYRGEITAVDVNHPERGPLARLPIVVIKAARPDDNKLQWKIVSDAGQNIRKFVEVPEGATWAELKVHRRDQDAQRFGFLHCIELVPGQTFEEGETMEVLRLDPESETTVNIPVTGGRTLEICWGHYWSSQGTANLDFALEFRGISTGGSSLALPSDGSATRVDVRAGLSRETLRPTASLTTLRRILVPASAGEATPLPGDRDALWGQQRTHRRLLKYPLTMASQGTVTLHCPELEGLLYDSPVDHFLMTVKDSNGRPVATDDVFAEPASDPAKFPVSLEAGDYTIELDIRHLDPGALDRWGDVAITLDQNLPSPIRVPAYPTRVAAAGTGRTFSSARLVPGEETALWFRFPDGTKIPSGAQPGDILLGTLKLSEDGPATSHGGDSLSLSYVVPAKASEKSSSQGQSGDYQQAYLEFLIDQLSGLKWPKDREQIEQISNDYTVRQPDDRRLAVARLHVIDNDNNEDHLPDVISAADQVIKLVDQNQLQTYFGIRHDPQSADEKKLHKELAEARSDLIDALYRKGRTLAHMELPEITMKHPIADQVAHDKLFEETFQELSKWADTKDAQYALLHLRRDWRKGDFGKALELLNQKYSGSNSRELHDKKRVDLLDAMGWDDWRDYQLRWNLRHYGRPAE